MEMKFKEQKGFARATGFRISNDLVVTAGHVLEGITKDLVIIAGHVLDGIAKDLPNWRLVFGMSSRDGKADSIVIPAYNVRTINSIVHCAIPPELNEKAHMNPLKVTSFAEVVQNIGFYDIVILKLKPENKLPAAVIPFRLAPHLPTRATVGRQVCLIGCPSGMSFKISTGGSVQELPLNTAIATKRGTFSADIDAFPGNSGGPLCAVDDNTVVGIAANVFIRPITPVYPGNRDMTSKDPIIRLEAEVNNWVQAQYDKYKDGAKYPRNANSDNNDPPLVGNHPIDEAYVKNFGPLLVTNFTGPLTVGGDPGTFTFGWHRCKSDAEDARRFVRFTRMDPFVLFANPFVGYNPQAPQNKISIILKVFIDDDDITKPRSPLKSTLGLSIHDGKTSHSAETVSGVSGDSHAPGADLEWILSEPPRPGNQPPVAARLPLSILDFAHGLCDGEMVQLTRQGAIQDDEVGPLGGSVSVIFSDLVGHDPNLTFTFKLTLEFVGSDGSKWTAFIGQKWNENCKTLLGDYWRGPLENQ